MEVLLLALALVLIWSLVGFAVATSLDRELNTVHALLVAPAIGLACFVLPLFWLGSAGFPSRMVGTPLTVTLVLASVLLLWRRRPALAWRAYAPFAFVLLMGLILVGWPALLHGLEWISFGNDDMTTFLQEAQV